MRTLYGAIAGYALLASGCVGPQCLQDCAARTKTVTLETRACKELLTQPITPGSREHALYNQHFKKAIENTLGAPPYVNETFFQLDPDHFEDHKDAITSIYQDTLRLQPWILQSDEITYERTEEKPPYRPYTQHATPATLADIVTHAIPPRRRTVLGEIGKTLNGWFGWLFHEQPH